MTECANAVAAWWREQSVVKQEKLDPRWTSSRCRYAVRRATRRNTQPQWSHIAPRLAVSALVRSRERQAVGALVALLSHEDQVTRARAAYGLYRLGEARAVPLLRKLLSEQGSRQSRAAAAALLALGEDFDEYILMDLLAAESRDSVFQNHVDALVVTNDRRIVPLLIARLTRQGDDPDTVHWAALALRRIGGDEVLKPLLDYYGSDERAVANAFSELGDTVSQALIDMHQDGALRTDLVAPAANLFSKFGTENAVPMLIDVIGSGDETAVFWAGGGLARLGDARAVDPLLSLLRDESWKWNFEELVQLLIPFDDPRVNERVIELLVSDDFDTRFGVEWTLGQTRATPGLIAQLVAGVRSDDVRVQDAAARGLTELRDPRSIEPLLAVVESGTWGAQSDAAKLAERIDDSVRPAACDVDESAATIAELWSSLEQDTSTTHAKELSVIRQRLASVADQFELVKGMFRERYSGWDLVARWVNSNDFEECVRRSQWAVEPLKRQIDEMDKKKKARVAVAGALYKSGVFAPLYALYGSDDWTTQFYAQNTLSFMREENTPRWAKRFLTLFGELDEPTRSAVVAALGAVTKTGMTSQELLDLLGSGSDAVRGAAVKVLGELGDPRAVGALIDLLQDNDQIGGLAARALGETGNLRAVEPLLQVFEEGDDSRRKNVAEALGKLGDRRAVSPLLEWLNDTYQKKKDVYIDNVQALGRLGDPRAIAPLRQILSCSGGCRMSSYDLARIVAALFQLGDPQAVEPFFAMLADDNESRRTVAKGTLFDGLQNVAPEVLARLVGRLKNDHEYKYVRGSVVEALGMTGSPEAVEVLIDLLDERNGWVRREVISALAGLGGSRATKVLVSRVRPADWFDGDRFIVDVFEDEEAREVLGRNADVRFLVSLVSEAAEEGVYNNNILYLGEAIAARGAYRPRLELLGHLWRYKYSETRVTTAKIGKDLKKLETFLPESEGLSPYTWLFAAILAGNSGDYRKALGWAEQGLASGPASDTAARIALSVVLAEALGALGELRRAHEVIEAVDAHERRRLMPLERIGRLALLEAELSMTRAFLESKRGRTQETVQANYVAEAVIKTAVRLDWIDDVLFHRLVANRIAPMQYHHFGIGRDRFKWEMKKSSQEQPVGPQEEYGRDLKLKEQIETALKNGDRDDYVKVRRAVETAALEAMGQPTNVHFSSAARQNSYERLAALKKEVEELERATSARAQKKSAEGAASEPGRSQDDLKKKFRKKQRELHVFVRRLKRQHADIAAMWGKSPIDLAQLSSHLGPKVGIVQYLVLGDSSFAFVVRHDETVDIKPLHLITERCVKPGVEQACLGNLARVVNRYRSLLGQEAPSSRAIAERTRLGSALATALLEPLGEHLKDLQHLMLVPNGVLHRLPFAALPWRGGHLVERKILTVLPAGSLVGALGARPLERPRGLLAMGNPIAQGQWAPLESAEAEVEALRKHLPEVRPKTILTGAGARKDSLVDQDLKGHILHLATHAESGNAERTRLLLTGGDLTYDEILGLDIQNAPLVVLSACQTGRGERLSGDQVYSLANAFLLAQARSVVFSLWLIDDSTTERLMGAFYRHFRLGKAVSVALAAAQRFMIREGYPPLSWAGFVVSEWSAPKR